MADNNYTTLKPQTEDSQEQIHRKICRSVADIAANSGTGSSSQQVQGTAADGAAVVGNPVQVAGKDDSGNAQTIRTGTNGNAKVDVDAALPAGGNKIGSVTAEQNSAVTALASAARTASVDSADLTNLSARGVHVVVDITAIVTAPSITVKIQGKDESSGKYYDLLTSAALTAVSTTILKVYPGLTAAANVVASDIIPKTFRVSVTNGNANSITYSIGASLVL